MAVAETMTLLPDHTRRNLAEAHAVAGQALPVEYDRLSRRERASVRMEYVRRQGGKCWHCGFPLDTPPAPEIVVKPINWDLFPPGFTKNPIHLHHSHETGLTIGAVHALCNAVLWQYHEE